jgi:ABC-2 type transport system ATP-binding protein
VLISSHFLAEISQTCDRLLVIHGGELVGQGSEEDLAAAMGQGSSTIEAEVRGRPSGMAARLAKIPGVSKADERDDSVATVFEIAASTDVRADVARLLVGAGCDLVRLDRSASRLESIFMNLTQKTTGGPQ